MISLGVRENGKPRPGYYGITSKLTEFAAANKGFNFKFLKKVSIKVFLFFFFFSGKETACFRLSTNRSSCVHLSIINSL